MERVERASWQMFDCARCIVFPNKHGWQLDLRLLFLEKTISAHFCAVLDAMALFSRWFWVLVSLTLRRRARNQQWWWMSHLLFSLTASFSVSTLIFYTQSFSNPFAIHVLYEYSLMLIQDALGLLKSYVKICKWWNVCFVPIFTSQNI